MSKLDQRRINFVKALPIDVRVQVLYEFLKKGTSNRNIERIIDDLKEEDGWQAWCVIHFYGFNKNNKAKYPKLTPKEIRESIIRIEEEDLEDMHLNIDKVGENQSGIVMGDNDGNDILRVIKARQGQFKLRKLLLHNYESKCALCNISHPRLLVASHIKPWAGSTAEDRVNPCNAILLCKNHDALFENGFIAFEDDSQVIFSSKFDFVGQKISQEISFRQPIMDRPSTNFLMNHRKRHGFE